MIEIKMYCEDDEVLDSLTMLAGVNKHKGYVSAKVISADTVSWVSELVTSLNKKNAAQIRLDVLDYSC